jgi:HTH-type transcriptional regulator / antitoxin HigA
LPKNALLGRIWSGVAVHQMHRRRLLDYRLGNRRCVDLAGTFTA